MNRKTRLLLGALLSVLLIVLGGCASLSVHQFGALDLSEKTITMSPGGDNFLGAIKERLYRDHWRISVYPLDKEITDLLANQEVRYKTFRTRYILLTDYKLFSNWSSSDSLASFDLSLIDNRSGSEVFTYSGSASILEVGIPIAKVVDGFVKELNDRSTPKS